MHHLIRKTAHAQKHVNRAITIVKISSLPQRQKDALFDVLGTITGDIQLLRATHGVLIKALNQDVIITTHIKAQSKRLKEYTREAIKLLGTHEVHQTPILGLMHKMTAIERDLEKAA